MTSTSTMAGSPGDGMLPMDSMLDYYEATTPFGESMEYADIWAGLPYRWALPLPVDLAADPGDPD